MSQAKYPESKTLASVGPQKKKQLLDCERRIQAAGQDGMAAWSSIGIDLKRIRDEELYLVTHSAWQDYIKEKWNFTPQQASALIKTGEIWPGIVEAAKSKGLPTPSNQNQLRPLLKYGEKKASDLWIESVEHAKTEKKAVTGAVVKEVITSVTPSPEPEEKPSNPTSAPKVTSSGDAHTPPPELDDFSEHLSLDDYPPKAKVVLARILAILGKPSYEAILSKTVPIETRDLIKWGIYSDEDFEAIGRFLIDQRWPLAKAVKYIKQTIDAKTKLEILFNLATARGGTARILVNGWTVDIHRE